MSAAKGLSELFQSPTLKSALMHKGTTWQFIHLVQGLLGKASWDGEDVIEEDLSVEVEAVLNDRPLTYLSSTTGDPKPLAPSHLLCECRIVPLPHPEVGDDEISDPNYHSADQLRSKMD